ncbi:hypothetical protein Glove_19g317 [Diversispora epigaea]|uniref:TLDc domain-containing protein n=1 Tax=Diversispora epigaea TaxID=1348612 RepID=A0A397JQE3_9GLOM|nr:hypothetical protein Glove_19g317 [Diversispora epigaea]
MKSRQQRFHPRTTSYSLTNNSHEFQLILQRSKDGFTTRTFWDICDGLANTIVFIEVKGKDKILGGFNPSARDRTKVRDMKTKNSFIFSFKDDNFQILILIKVQNQNYPWYLF